MGHTVSSSLFSAICFYYFQWLRMLLSEKDEFLLGFIEGIEMVLPESE